MTTGRIYRIESMSAADGPGMRYVVFLQGCALNCVFCHNADSRDPRRGYELDTDTLISNIRRALPYLSGGGVTLSGGEPLMQAGFCVELLRRLKRTGIHTAIETSGFSQGNGPFEVFALCDLVMVDIKSATDEGYRRITQNTAGLACALTALDAARGLGKKTVARHVVLPGINDDEASMDLLAATLSPYPGVNVELLPYHTMGAHKWPAPSPIAHLPAMDRERVLRLQGYIDSIMDLT